MFKLNKFFLIVAITFLALILLISCFYYYNVETTVGTVASYCQKTSHWCGAACAQMIIEFCCKQKASPAVTPSWYGTLYANQTHIYNWMQTYHTDHGLSSPYKHPDAVKGAIMSLKESAPGHFVVFHSTDKNKVLHDMFYWMKTMGYPSATMRNGTHWVLVYAFKTNVEPTISNTVTLENISILDPSPFCSGGTVIDNRVGHEKHIDASGWDANYWSSGMNFSSWSGSPYHGEYVAVVEPPVTKGRVRIKKAYVGKKEEIIPIGLAMKKAREYVRKKELIKYESMKFMAEAQPQTAILVEWPDNKRYYYLVPFGAEKEGPAKAVMILNPYNGNYQECGSLIRPLSFLSKDKAVRLIMEKTGIKKYDSLTAFYKYAYSNLSYSHYYPFLEVKIDREIFYVNQDRKVQRELLYIHKPPR